MTTPEGFKSGFVAIVGRPNVGKSTLTNKLVGRKLAIMSDKPQTTRNKITAVLTTDTAQLVFIDTPGIHRPKHKLGEYMVNVAQNALYEVDIVLFVVEADQSEIGPGDNYIIEQLRGIKTPVVLVINKSDLVENTALLPVIETYRHAMDFAHIIPVSAVSGLNVPDLINLLVEMLPPGPQYYPEDMITDQPERAIIKEIIREKVLHMTREEIPHCVAVEIEEIKPRKNELVYVRGVIFTERDSQKGIIVGKNGQILKKIGELARGEMENLLGSKVYLDLWVKVRKDWRNKESFLKDFGYVLKE
ncbi:MAG: GTPase Era [Thermincola sp.]|nr:GTPase Era [Thermincola sp.]MDT3704293.1 GTPase Era [Thermincola sp.]